MKELLGNWHRSPSVKKRWRAALRHQVTKPENLGPSPADSLFELMSSVNAPQHCLSEPNITAEVTFTRDDTEKYPPGQSSCLPQTATSHFAVRVSALKSFRLTIKYSSPPACHFSLTRAMPLPLRDFENRLNALNEALDSLRSVIQHPTHTISPADISNGYLEELRMMDFSQDRYGQAHGTAETHPTTHRFHASRVATPGDDHLHEAMARQRQQSYNLQEQPWTVPAGDPSTEKRELDLMVRKIKDTINVRLTLIEMIKTEVELYEDKKKRVKEAYFDYVKAKRGGEVEGTKKVAYEVLYNCLVDAGNTLFTLEVSILALLLTAFC